MVIALEIRSSIKDDLDIIVVSYKVSPVRWIVDEVKRNKYERNKKS